MEWKNPWNKKQLVCLFLIAFAAVPIFIEYLLKNALDLLLGEGMLSAMLMSIAMAAVFILSLYYIALKAKPIVLAGNRNLPVRPCILDSNSGMDGFFNRDDVCRYGNPDLVRRRLRKYKNKTISCRSFMLSIAMSFASACIVSPIYEELFYRGFLYRWLRAEFGVVWALVASSALSYDSYNPHIQHPGR